MSHWLPHPCMLLLSLQNEYTRTKTADHMVNNTICYLWLCLCTSTDTAAAVSLNIRLSLRVAKPDCSNDPVSGSSRNHRAQGVLLAQSGLPQPRTPTWYEQYCS